MRTHNLDIKLMLPMQVDKDIIFNEAQIKLDCFANIVVEDIVNTIEGVAVDAGKKYIVQNIAEDSKLYYCADASKGWQFISPKEDMLIYILSREQFFLFKNKVWTELTIKYGRPEAISFVAVAGNYTLNDNCAHYLYLNDDSSVDLSIATASEYLLIIKQNYQTCYNLSWPANILWPGKECYNVTQLASSTDIIRLYKIPETQHFLAQIIGTNYQF